MKSSKKIKVGVSIGDLNGIGGELIVKTFEDKRVLEFCTPIIYASIKTMTFFKQHFSSAIHFNVLKSIDQVAHSKINVINVWNNEVKIEFGKETTQAGRYAIASFEAAVQDLKTDKIDMRPQWHRSLENLVSQKNYRRRKGHKPIYLTL